MSAMIDQNQGNNQAVDPNIWGLIEETEMKSKKMTVTGKSNIPSNPAKFHPIKTLRVMTMGAMLTASVLLSGSTASADEPNRPLAKEQVAQVGNWDDYADARDILPKVEQVILDWDTYVDARDILISQTGFKSTAKLGSSNSGPVGNWDAYVDARDLLVSESEFKSSAKLGSSKSGTVGDWDAYVDARDLLVPESGFKSSAKVGQVDSDFDAYVDARDILNSQTGLPLTRKVGYVDSDFDAYVDARDISPN